MTLTEIKRWSLSEPTATQQMVGELVAMVEKHKNAIVDLIDRRDKDRKIIRKAAFLEAIGMIRDKDFYNWREQKLLEEIEHCD